MRDVTTLWLFLVILHPILTALRIFFSPCAAAVMTCSVSAAAETTATARAPSSYRHVMYCGRVSWLWGKMLHCCLALDLSYKDILIPLSHFWISAACGENKNFLLPPLLEFWLKKYDFSSTSHLLRIFQPKFQEG